MTVKFKSPYMEEEESYLADFGAATSLEPEATYRAQMRGAVRRGFQKTKLKLRPSAHKLMAASGCVMPGLGIVDLSLCVPGTREVMDHPINVMQNGAMPAGLNILGVDFWDRVNPRFKWAAREIHCTSPSGTDFVLKFSIGDETTATDVNSVWHTEEGWNKGVLLKDLTLLPKQRAIVDIQAVGVNHIEVEDAIAIWGAATLSIHESSYQGLSAEQPEWH